MRNGHNLEGLEGLERVSCYVGSEGLAAMAVKSGAEYFLLGCNAADFPGFSFGIL